jgi:Tol biopolymer transport system component
MARWAPRLLAVLSSYVAQSVAQEAPTVTHWTLPGASSPMWESHPAIDPLTGDLWFVRSDKMFSGWRIFVSRCSDGRRSSATPSAVAGPGLEADPWFSADGRTLWFISTRSTGAKASSALDIWRAQRSTNGTWQKPQRLPEPVNSAFAEWFPRPAPDGWLYFGSRRPGGQGKDDIWRARESAAGSWTVENVGAGLNSAGADYEFQPAPDGTWGVLATDQGLFRVTATATGWQRAGKFGPEVNANGTEIGPLIAPDGRSFVFSRDTGAASSGELFIARLDPTGQWPPQRCQSPSQR